MLVAIAKNTNTKKVAKYTTKEEGPFICPGCRKEVIFKRGGNIANAFAHRPGSECLYGLKERPLYRQAKMELYDALIEKGYPVELEYTFTGCSGKTYLVDLLVTLPKGKVIIELDKFSLTPAEIRQQIQDCQELDIAVFWTGFIKGRDLKDRYLPTSVERLCHKLGNGTVLYWSGGLNFKACHYLPYTPKNKLVEQTYKKYVIRQFKQEKISFDTLIFSSVNDKEAGVVCRYLMTSEPDWYCKKDTVL